MSLKHFLPLAAIVVIGGTTGLLAQDPVRNLQDLVGARGRDAESEMQQRGFNFLRRETSGDDIYMYFRESRNNRCVTVHMSDGRYQSIVYVSNLDCDRNNSNNGGGGGVSEARNLQDLVNARARDGETELQQRGYRMVRNEMQGGARMNWWQRGNNECIAIEVADGRYSFLNSVPMSQCRAGNNNGGGFGNKGGGFGNGGGGGNNNNNGGNVGSAPRVNVDTEGRGSLSGGSFNNARVDRGYVNTRDGVSVGLRANGRVVTFYGDVTDSRSNRDFTIRITNSSEGRANGTVTVRLNGDRNEVDSINITGNMDGSRLNGSFNR